MTSPNLIPELGKSLKNAGLIGAFESLDSNRFKRYLKRPMKLLNDRWTYVERSGGGMLYRLGSPRGLCQELQINRGSAEAVLKTYDPRHGREQAVTYDLKKDCVVSNVVTYDFAEGSAIYNLTLKGEEESLEFIEPAPDNGVADDVFAVLLSLEGQWSECCIGGHRNGA